MINGYHGARIRRYQEIIDNGLISQFRQASNGDFSRLHLLNMLNTKFLITNTSSPTGVTENPNALGAAWFVDNLIKASNPDEEFNGTLRLTDPLKTAIVDGSEVSMELVLPMELSSLPTTILVIGNTAVLIHPMDSLYSLRSTIQKDLKFSLMVN